MSFGSWFTSKISGAWQAVKAPFTDPVPKPVVNPIPVPSDPSKPIIKLEMKVGSGKFYPQSIPINSSCPWPAAKARVKTQWATVRVTVLSGALTLKGTSANGPNNPSIEGHKTGILGTNALQEWKLYIGPLTNTRKPGQTYEQSNYSIVTKELGELLKVSANVEHPK